MAFDLKALEQKTIEELRLVVDELPNISALIASIKASKAEALAEKFVPGLGALEQKAIDEIAFLSGFASKTLKALEILISVQGA